MKDLMENFTLSTFLRHLFCGVMFLVSYQRATEEIPVSVLDKAEFSVLVLGGLAVTCGVLIYAIEMTLINSVFHALRHKYIPKNKYYLWNLDGLKTVEARWKAAVLPGEEKKFFQKKLSEGADYVHLQLSCAFAIALGGLLGTLREGKLGSPAWELIVAGVILLLSSIVADVRRHSLQRFLFR